MDQAKARDVLSNLLERLQKNTATEGATWRLETITQREREALAFALAALGKSPSDVPPSGLGHSTPAPAPPTPDLAPRVLRARADRPRQPSIELQRNERRLDSDRSSSDTLMCLDFGTARSKAFASRTKGGRTELLPLALGELAGESGVYGVTSSVWIDDDGLMFFGRDAVDRHSTSTTPGRRRVDSLKNALSQSRSATGEIADPAQRLLNDVLPEANPTDVPLTEGDVLLLYLAYLTDLAERDLRSRYGVEDFVRRRFALPCWDERRRKSGMGLLKRYLARAQIVADSVNGRWRDGLDSGRARDLLERVRNLRDDALPLSLVDEGIPEPIAAGASRIRKGEAQRGLVMVVDVGAGTTDFAVFLVNENPNRDTFKLTPQTQGRGVNFAGDKLDQILMATLLDRSNLHGAERTRAGHDLEHRRRMLKENLFETGAVSVRLVTDDVVPLTRDEFLELGACRTFGEKLEEEFNATLAEVDATTMRSFKDTGITVVLTGGGANLPMVTELASRGSRRRLAPTPQGLGEELRREYGQLAVSMGGAHPDLPAVGRELGSIDTYTIHNVRPPRGFGG